MSLCINIMPREERTLHTVPELREAEEPGLARLAGPIKRQNSGCRQQAAAVLGSTLRPGARARELGRGQAGSWGQTKRARICPPLPATAALPLASGRGWWPAPSPSQTSGIGDPEDDAILKDIIPASYQGLLFMLRDLCPASIPLTQYRAR